MWPNILWVGPEDAGLGLKTVGAMWIHGAPSAEQLHWNGLEASQISWFVKLYLSVHVWAF